MEIDDKILKNAMDKLNITEEQAEKSLQEMLDQGLLQKNDDPSIPSEFKLTPTGCRYVEEMIIEKYGEFKKVIDHKGITYKIPTVVIIRGGINEEDLNQFPLWSDEN